MLVSGSRLGPYEIVVAIGAGGMGEVYKARDTRLDRTVAIKILPETLAADPQFRDRFDREARTISQLDHPHICALYDVGEERGASFLVMQFLEGETLEARLQSAAAPIDQALQIGIQIADALDAAHRCGIVHRDLKPGNVMLTRSGAKLLDFGLAKVAAPTISSSSLSMLPTTPPNLTANGAILGTFQYMAPEQIEGLEADARTDIFAFGAVLYEMLTGRHAFDGKTRAQLLGAILKDDPPSISPGLLADARVTQLDRLIGDCLAKDPDDRWQSVRDVRRELARIAAAPRDAANSDPTPPHWRSTWLWRTAAALFAATTATLSAILLLSSRSPAATSSVTFTISPPDGARFSSTPGSTDVPPLALSPDGRWLVFGAANQLWIRPLNALAARALPGTEGGRYPFWSPDNKTIAFLTQGELRKVELAGGTAQKLADADNGSGGTWGRDGTIVLALTTRGLFRVPASGGILDALPGPPDHSVLGRHPFFLPDGRHYLYLGRSSNGDNDALYAAALDSPEQTRITSASRMPQYASGHLLFVSGATLMAQPFDSRSLRLSGTPVAVADLVPSSITGYSSFSVSQTGSLAATAAATRADRQLVWFDRSGKRGAVIGAAGAYDYPQLLRDGRVLFQRRDDSGAPGQSIWILDPARNVDGRMADGSNAAISPDEQQVMVNPGPRARSQGLRRVGLNTSATAEELLSGKIAWPNDWSPDGKYLLFMHPEMATKFDVSVIDLANGNTVTPLIQTTANEGQARFSPDQHWVAYVSDESGRPEVYVRHFPDGNQKTTVSHGGGRQPRWDHRGRSLFYLATDNTLMDANVELHDDRIVVGAPQALFRAPVADSTDLPVFGGSYAPTGDGSRFLIAEEIGSMGPRVNVILNWLSKLSANP